MRCRDKLLLAVWSKYVKYRSGGIFCLEKIIINSFHKSSLVEQLCGVGGRTVFSGFGVGQSLQTPHDNGHFLLING